MSGLASWIAVAVVALVAGYVLAQRGRLRHDREMERERMLHETRLRAIEKGMDPQLPEPSLFTPEPRTPLPEILATLARLCGAVLVAGGLGFVAGFALVPETKQTLGMTELAPLGLVPAAVGAGLLVYAWLARRG